MHCGNVVNAVICNDLSFSISLHLLHRYEVSQAESAAGTSSWHLNTCLLIVTLLAMIGDILGIKSISKVGKNNH